MNNIWTVTNTVSPDELLDIIRGGIKLPRLEENFDDLQDAEEYAMMMTLKGYKMRIETKEALEQRRSIANKRFKDVFGDKGEAR